MRALVWSSLLLVPAVLVADVLGLGGSWLFVLSAAALVPLAYVIGEATEQAGEHTGPAIAGLLNASMGNAPELIISIFAVQRGLFDFVRGSLTGSIVSNMLLVLGATLLASRGGRINRRTATVSLVQTGFAVALFVIPATAHGWNPRDTAVMAPVTAPVVVVLLVVYLAVTARGVLFHASRQRQLLAESPADAVWSLSRSIVVLAVAAVATALVSEVLTGSVEDFSSAAGLDEFFVAAVIVALVGNAAEHGGAVVIAWRGNVELAAEIPLSSGAQVGLFVIPVVVLVSYMINPLPLAFRPVELATMAGAVLLPALVVAAGRASRFVGGGLCLAYAAVVASYYAVA